MQTPTIISHKHNILSLKYQSSLFQIRAYTWVVFSNVSCLNKYIKRFFQKKPFLDKVPMSSLAFLRYEMTKFWWFHFFLFLHLHIYIKWSQGFNKKCMCIEFHILLPASSGSWAEFRRVNAQASCMTPLTPLTFHWPSSSEVMRSWILRRYWLSFRIGRCCSFSVGMKSE